MYQPILVKRTSITRNSRLLDGLSEFEINLGSLVKCAFFRFVRLYFQHYDQADNN